MDLETLRNCNKLADEFEALRTLRPQLERMDNSAPLCVALKRGDISPDVLASVSRDLLLDAIDKRQETIRRQLRIYSVYAPYESAATAAAPVPAPHELQNIAVGTSDTDTAA